LFISSIFLVIYNNKFKKVELAAKKQLIYNISETLFFIILNTFLIAISGLNYSPYKITFCFIMISVIIQHGFKSGIIVSIFCSMIIFSIDLIEDHNRPNPSLQIDIILVGSYLTIAWLVGYYSEKKHRLNMLEQQLVLQEVNILETKENHLEVRKIWHDTYNHLNNISLLLKNNKVNECIEFIEKYTNTLNDISLKVNSGNIFIDALISRTINECENENIVFVQNIILPEEIQIDNVDICIIIGNALDNAIEACKKISTGTREITIQIKMLKNYIVIDIKNTICANPFSKTGTLYTDKQDKIRHGLGLLNIKNIVNKYSGELSLTHEEDLFIFNAILKNISVSY
jgi:sensor histidine kinase YesM